MTAAKSSPKTASGVFRRPRDMFLSLAVLLVPIGAFFLLWSLLTGGTQPAIVDPGPAFTEAAGSGLAVAEPTDLPKDWVPITSSVRHSGETVTLRVGYQTPAGAGIQLVESDVAAEKLLAAELPDGTQPLGDEELPNGQWSAFQTRGGNALVFSDDEVTYLVHGDTDVAELRSFAGTLN